MDINSIQLLTPWDGTGYVLFHQVHGFNFVEKRFNEGIIVGENCALLFNHNLGVNKDKFLKIIEALMALPF